MNDSRKGGLTFPKRSPQRLLMGVADREIVSVLSLADSNIFVLTQSERRGGRLATRGAGGGGRKDALGRVDQSVEGLPPSEIGEHKGEHPLFQPRSAIGLEGEFE